MLKIPYSYKKRLYGLLFFLVLLFTIVPGVMFIAEMSGSKHSELVTIIAQFSIFFPICRKVYAGKKVCARWTYVFGIIAAHLLSKLQIPYYDIEIFLFNDGNIFSYYLTIMLVVGLPLDIACAITYSYSSKLIGKKMF